MDTKQPNLLENFDCSQSRIQSILENTLSNAEDGELYTEFSEVESLSYDNGKLKNGSFSNSQGFGLRAVVGEASAYAHAGDLSEAALKRASDAVSAIQAGYSGTYSAAPEMNAPQLYSANNPNISPSFEQKVKILEEIDAYARAKDPKVRQVSASITSAWRVIEILRRDGSHYRDIRPIANIRISIIAAEKEGNGERQESGSHGMGWRMGLDQFLTTENWQSVADEALRQALVNLEAIPAPAGSYDVVLGPGWPGVMLHEAVGHGLEGDFNRKGTSAFSGLMGEQVAAKGVTVIDDGTIANRRGSLSIDDEGTPSQNTTLIEDGILVGYMQDRQNARLMGMESTGNCRRESYAHAPMPRMTNTYMLSGDKTHDEIVESVKDGIYAKSFGGGQVDITSGKYVFECTEAYRIENGKITAPLKGATMIGNGPQDMMRIKMLGNNMELDPGFGACGKAGQTVPVGVGQPSVLMEDITIGGTAT
jgi:TldD protein